MKIPKPISSAIFLAAGLGTRLKPFTLKHPKPIIPFLNLPLMFHAVDFLTQATSCCEAIINYHHLGDQVLGFLGANRTHLPFKRVKTSDESKQILESGGAIANCEALLRYENNFWTFNADEVVLPLSQDFNLGHLIDEHIKTQSLATLLVTKNDKVGIEFGGAWADSNNQVVRFSKAYQKGLFGWHYVGLMLLSSKIFRYTAKPAQPENILYDVLARGIAAGESVQVYPADLLWVETGVLSEFKKNENFFRQEIGSKTALGLLMQGRLERYPKFRDIII